MIELDGAPVVVSVDDDAVLWTCDLRGGGCVSRSLDLDAAGPDDSWYIENEYWDEDDDEDVQEWIVVEPSNIAELVTATYLDGRPVVVTGGRRYDFSFEGDSDSSGGIVRAWDLRTGRRIGSVMIGHVLGVCSLTTVESERGPLVVSTCEPGVTLAWELATGERVTKIEGAYNGVMGAAVVDGRPVAVTGGMDPFLQVWDVLTGDRIGGDLRGIEPGAGPIAITEVEGRAVVLGGDGARLHVWDLASQEPIGIPLTGHTDDIRTLGTTTVAGRSIAVTGSSRDFAPQGEGETRVWDLARGEQIGLPFAAHLQQVTEIAGIPVAVTRSLNDAIHLWDLTRAVG
ncbi:WD40 repeat domain-containing protein [Actinomadura vinacea]|uniref:WD40 repeat domain-containing protein n=1 Tax=Actinomadura vinacea TaxID=115336 RepID=UPI0031DDC3F9